MTFITKIQKGIKDPKRGIKVINNRLFGLVGHNNFTPFIILTRSRTGSNMLVSFFNSHPNVFCEAEIFGDISKHNYQEILRRTFRKQPHYCKAKGFKIFYYHPRDKSQSDVWKELVAMEKLHVIHLKRRNILKTLISRRIAGLTDTWKTQSKKVVNKSMKQNLDLNLTTEDLKEGFEKTQQWEREGGELFKDPPLISIDYEDLVANPEATFRQVTDFLGLVPMKPKTALKKQTTRSMRDSLPNYDSLKADFADSPWASYFED